MEDGHNSRFSPNSSVGRHTNAASSPFFFTRRRHSFSTPSVVMRSTNTTTAHPPLLPTQNGQVEGIASSSSSKASSRLSLLRFLPIAAPESSSHFLPLTSTP